MAVARETFPNLHGLEDLYQMHNLDAGLLKDYATGELYMVTWLSLPAIKYWQLILSDETFDSKKRSFNRKGFELILEKLKKFSDANAEVYGSVVGKIQENPDAYPFEVYWTGKTLTPLLPKRIAAEFETFSQK